MVSPKERIEKLCAELKTNLEEGIIPFWLQRGWDKDFGGFLTNFDENGRALSTPEKYLNTQARMIWWFSTLSRQYPERDDFVNMAANGVDFIIHNFWDSDYGGWFWKTRRDGACLDDGKVVYGQSFAIYALSEYYRATKDDRGLQLSSDTFDLLQIHCADTLHGGYYENLERDWSLAPAGFYGGDRKGLDTHMHLMEAFTTLYAASGKSLHKRKLMEVLDLIVQKMIDPESGCGRNQFDLAYTPIPAIALNRTWNAEREGEVPAVPTDTTSYGHNVELAWLINRAIEIAGTDPALYCQTTNRLLNHTVEHGVDWEYGGIYRDGTALGDALIKDKEFWQNAEALVGFLDGYAHTGKLVYLDAFENVWHFVNTHMVNQKVGEWRTLLNREGEPIDPKIGNPWKVAYHSGRATLECYTRLKQLVQEVQ
jgi:mannobiose 2-epimerase